MRGHSPVDPQGFRQVATKTARSALSFALPMVAMLLGVVTFATPSGAIVISGSAGTTTSVAGASTQITFDLANGPLVSSIGAGYALNTGSSPGGGGNFAAAVNLTGTTITFTTLLDYVGLAWGTPDTYNQFSLYNGATLIAGPYNNSVVTNTFTNFFASNPSEYFNRVVIYNNINTCCFEFDNVAARAATSVPEPNALFLLGAAMGLLGIARRMPWAKPEACA